MQFRDDAEMTRNRILRSLLPLSSSAVITLLALQACGSNAAHQHAEPEVQQAPQVTEEATERTLSAEEALALFDDAIAKMESAGALSDMDEEDWQALSERFRKQAEAAGDNQALRAVLGEMIDSLGKSHFAIIPQEAVAETPSDAVGPATLGLTARYADGLAIITEVDAGSAADEAGVRPGWCIDTVNGREIADFFARFGEMDPSSMGGYQRNAGLNAMLTTRPGNLVELELLDLDGEAHEFELEGREQSLQMIRFGNLPPMSVSTDSSILGKEELKAYGVEVDEGYQVGLLRFSVWMVPIMQPILKAVDDFRTAGVDAVIIDLRGNPGGVGGLAMGVGGHFFEEPVSLGTMYNDFGEMQFNTNPQRLSPDGKLVKPLSTPLAIIIDEMSASTSEIFAGGMQSAERATIVGRRTPGMALPAVAEELPNGDILYHAIAEFERPDGRTVEGVGIAPDAPVLLEQAAFGTSCDPDVRTAVELMLEMTTPTAESTATE